MSIPPTAGKSKKSPGPMRFAAAFGLGIVAFAALAYFVPPSVPVDKPTIENSAAEAHEESGAAAAGPPRSIASAREVPRLPVARPDYVRLLNDEFSRGVTPENNAAVVVLQLAGADVVPEDMRAQYFAQLGVEVPEERLAFLEWDDFAALQGMRQSRADAINMLLRLPANYSVVDLPELVEYVEAQRPQLARLHEGLKLPRFYLPLTTSETYLPTCFPTASFLAPWEDIVRSSRRMLDVRCQYRWQTGDVDGAIDDFVALARLCRHATRLPIADDSLWSDINYACMEAFYQFISGAKFTDQQLQRLSRELQALPPHVKAAEHLDRCFRYFALDRVYMAAANANTSENEYHFAANVDVGSVLGRVNLAIDSLRDAAANNDLGARQNRLGYLKAELTMSDSLPRAQDASKTKLEIGNRHVVRAFYPDPTLVYEADRASVSADLLQVATALQRHRLAIGTYPENLGQLVPALLDKIPVDPWTGTPFKYAKRLQFYTLYSCGPNGIDELGRQDREFTLYLKADDVRFGLPPPTPNLFSEFLKGSSAPAPPKRND